MATNTEYEIRITRTAQKQLDKLPVATADILIAAMLELAYDPGQPQ